jgi:L-asparaginase
MQVSGKTIVVLGTGGTIAGRAASARDNLGYRAGAVGIGELLRDVPAAQGLTVRAEQVANIDSKDMDFATWRALAQRCAHWLAQEEVAGIVVTHGTDTMEETAFFLQSVLAPVKPVVLTGAMRPATSAGADGPVNLADAIAVAASPAAQGVCVAFAGTLHGPEDVQKMHSYRLDAFSSGDAGPLGYVEEGRVRLLRAWPRAGLLRTAQALPDPEQWPRVEIVMNHAGADGALVRTLVREGVAGIVAAATGNGTLRAELQEALLAAQDHGVSVLRSTRCAQGHVIALNGDPLPATPLSPVKARVQLLLQRLP